MLARPMGEVQAMIPTVPIQIDLGSPLGWVLAGIVAVLAIWGALGLLQQARRL